MNKYLADRSAEGERKRKISVDRDQKEERRKKKEERIRNYREEGKKKQTKIYRMLLIRL